MLRVVSRVRDFYATSATSLRGCWTVRTVQRRFRPCAGRSSEGIGSAGYVAIFSMLVINWSFYEGNCYPLGHVQDYSLSLILRTASRISLRVGLAC